MFKVIVTEFFGPFCGMGGYGSETLIGMDRSPARAMAKATLLRHAADGSQIRRTSNENPKTGICGGGVPILRNVKIFRGHRLLSDKWD